MSKSELVYHGTPTLYPEQSGEMRMGAVRFSRPVRLSSLRVVPDGVVCPGGPGGGVGETSPGEFTLEVFLNVAPSDPVNALAKTTARVVPAPHALDFALDMPEGTATRLIVLRAPARRITLSIYAHADEHATPVGREAPPPSLSVSPPTALNLPSPQSLLAALPTLDDEGRRRALTSLGLLAHRNLSLESVLASLNVEALMNAGEGADAAIASMLGLDSTDSVVDPRKALPALLSLPSKPWATVYPDTEAPLSIVLKLAEAQARSSHPRAGDALATTLARLASVLEHDNSRTTAARLARALPPLAANAAARGASVTLPPTLDARTVLRSLLPASASVAGGQSCAYAARALAAPFLAQLPSDDPLRRAWDPRPALVPGTASPFSGPASVGASPLPSVPTLQVNPPDGPAPISQTVVTRLGRALDARSSSIQLSPTPAELLAALAPDLLASLSTAKVPPLGIPASRAAQGSASDYAGKVYSAHEFRREREMVSGLGIGATSAGRKASRHVDEFGS